VQLFDESEANILEMILIEEMLSTNLLSMNVFVDSGQHGSLFSAENPQ
jgi:hypothetical protein